MHKYWVSSSVSWLPSSREKFYEGTPACCYSFCSQSHLNTFPSKFLGYPKIVSHTLYGRTVALFVPLSLSLCFPLSLSDYLSLSLLLSFCESGVYLRFLSESRDSRLPTHTGKQARLPALPLPEPRLQISGSRSLARLFVHQLTG